MGLESNIEGDGNFLDHLNPLYPESTDYPGEGDDHMRGIKKILQNTFPNFNSQISRSSADVQNSAIPDGSICMFYQSAIPAGWERTQGLDNSLGYMLRVVASADTAGGGGGTDNPISNDKVASHTHSVAGRNVDTAGGTHDHTGDTHYKDAPHVHTGDTHYRDVSHNHTGRTGHMTVNWSHAHNGWVNDVGAHTHYIPDNANWNSRNSTGGYTGSNSGPGPLTVGDGGHTHGGIHTYNTDTNHQHDFTSNHTSINHRHYFQTNTGNINHRHYFRTSGTSTDHQHYLQGFNTDANGGAANWLPTYRNVMFCTRKFIP